MGISRATLFLSGEALRVYLTVLLQPYQAACLDPLLPVAVAAKMEDQGLCSVGVQSHSMGRLAPSHSRCGFCCVSAGGSGVLASIDILLPSIAASSCLPLCLHVCTRLSVPRLFPRVRV